MNRIKKLLEVRAKALEEIQNIQVTAETEERALTEEEIKKFNELEQKIRNIDATVDFEERAASMTMIEKVTTDAQPQQEELDERAFENYVMGRAVELRAGEQNLTMSGNGAIVPVSIAKRVIKVVKDICPIFANAIHYNAKGTIKVPVYGKSNTTHDIMVAYQEEFKAITADVGKFTSVDLGGYLVGALSLISRSLENNSVFSVVEFIINEMAEKIAEFLEGECLIGTNGKAQGACSTTNVITADSTTEVTADELIDLQLSVKTPYQANACWTMNAEMLRKIRKLKDKEGRYLLISDVTKEFPYMLLGKPVNLSDNMPIPAAGATTILYGDYSGLSVNMRESITIEVLREKYAELHAYGVISWFEFDSKITDNQKLAVLKQKASE